MSQTDPIWEDQNKRITQASEKYFERISPWLLDIGSWIFGGLIAFNLILLGPIVTIGPVDLTIMVATTALAVVLPLDVAGLVLLRLVRDLEHVDYEFDLEKEVRQVVESVGFTPGEQMTSPETLEAVRKRRVRTTLIYSSAILTLSIVFTLAGVVAALWHMAWWIAVAFAVTALISLIIVTIASVASRPPESAAERAQRRRYTDMITRQAKEQARKNKERK